MHASKVSVEISVDGTNGEFQANNEVVETTAGCSYTFRYVQIEA